MPHGYIIKIYKWLIVFYTRGNFATVKLAIHKKSGEKFAIKIIDKKKFLLSNATKRKNALMDEVFILKQVDHKNVSPRKNQIRSVFSLLREWSTNLHYNTDYSH